MAPFLRTAWAAVVLTACQSSSNTSAGVDRFESWDRCQLSTPGLPQRTEARCHSFPVPEDHDNPAGRSISLHVAVLPSDAFRPVADPLFFLAGGPGQAASESYAGYGAAFARVNRKRDIVLVDQRGTGQSNPLACALPADQPLLGGGELSAEQTAAWLRGCLETYDVDPVHFTTAAAVGDLEAVRSKLGYERINVYGISYGTRVALELLRHHPDRVRAVILDGVVPSDLAVGMDAAADAQRALDLILARCAGEPTCADRFPDLTRRLDGLLERLERAPVQLAVRHPRTGELQLGQFDRTTFASTLRMMTYAPETVSLLPLWLDEAATSGSFDRFASQALLAFSSMDETIARGLNLSVLCSEDVPFWTEAYDPKTAYLGDAIAREIRGACAVWPKAPATPRAPVTSDVPVLLLSGEADPVTPPAYGERAAKSLPNSLHLVAPGLGHGVLIHACLHRVATEFIDAASVADLDTRCLHTIRPEPFFVSRGGPEP